MSLEYFFANSPTTHYTQGELALLDRTPRHVAIIMDGNRRWARKQHFSKVLNLLDGHWQGAEVLTTITEASLELGIQCLTVYAFSTENWKRSPEEVKTLMQVLLSYLRGQRQKMINEGVKLGVIGDLTPFDEEVRGELAKTVEATKAGKRLTLTIALNYGGRDELRRAALAMAQDYKEGKIQEISEELLSRYLDTGHLPDPDLLIRTSGEKRLSNFLLWQIAYSEVYITDRLWPEFTPQDLLEALLDYQKRERRIGQ